ncbi:MAG TPA: class I SAM-dependent methyltransferase [Actinomycetota bacterium]|nr:class I SAM-dependent methyltransferase [Actinomycetota bacterium]
MFDKTARFYDAIYSFKDYPAEAARVQEIVEDRNPGAHTLLDVACGTGRHLEHLRERFAVEGLDLDPALLAVARERLGPDVPLHVADMVAFDLGRAFDAVTCLFSAIAYARTGENLARAVERLLAHTAPGGVVIVEPFFERSQWRWPEVHATYVDEPDLKIARMNRTAEPGETIVMEFEYLIGTPKGIERATERHEVGAFTRGDYQAAFRAAGVEPEWTDDGLMEDRGLWIAIKPA